MAVIPGTVSGNDSRWVMVGDAGWVPSLKKQPTDVFIMYFDFTNWLGAETTTLVLSPLSTHKATFYPSTQSSGTILAPSATIDSVDSTGRVLRVKLGASQGGTDGYRGYLNVQAFFVNNEVKEVEIDYTVEDTKYKGPVT